MRLSRFSTRCRIFSRLTNSSGVSVVESTVVTLGFFAVIFGVGCFGLTGDIFMRLLTMLVLISLFVTYFWLVMTSPGTG